MTHPRDRRPPRWRLGTLLAVVAMVAANLTLWAGLNRAAGWRLALVVVAVNAVLCLMAGAVVRFRLVPLLALFTTAELTEALLLQSALSDRGGDWIAAVAVLGGLALLAVMAGLSAARRVRRQRRTYHPCGPWALDSGAFTELNRHGAWTVTARQYASELQQWRAWGHLDFAGQQDWMCEPFVVARTGLTVATHQARTRERPFCGERSSSLSHCPSSWRMSSGSFRPAPTSSKAMRSCRMALRCRPPAATGGPYSG